MPSLTIHRAIALLLAVLTAGVATGTAVARDNATSTARASGWRGEKGHGHDGTGTTPSVPTASTGRTSPTTPTTPTTAATPTTPTTPAHTPTTPTTPANPGEPTPPAAEPALGRSVALATGSGVVTVRPPGGGAATALTDTAAALPTGTRVDTRRGEVVLTSAVDAAGATQTARFSGGVFEVRQVADGYTQIVLVGGRWSACPAKRAHAGARAAVGVAVAAKKRKPIRRLWGKDDNGRFQTRGGGSVATVRGTRWLTEDFCDGTRTTVAEGAVSVRSRKTGKTALVRAGHSRFVPR